MNIISRPTSSYGWLETKLPKEAMDHLWDCVETTRGERWNPWLSGHIDGSFRIEDKNDWFWNNIIQPHVDEYGKQFNHSHTRLPVKGHKLSIYLDTIWVNYQNQNEFSPMHDHDGVYSFAVWMKIPTHHDEQNQLNNGRDTLNSTFQFQYTDTFGDIVTSTYQMNPDKEGTMLFFPARLMHGVHPFYNCDEQRISISGNVALR